MNTGKFVISLDFELHWGFFDNRSLEDCKAQLGRINSVIDRLIEIANTYNVNLTFATVGFLFAKDKIEVGKFLPKSKPNYSNKKLNPYDLLEELDEQNSPYYFAQKLIKRLKNQNQHEIGTHTFSHYYCYENGQTINDFKADIEAAIAIANNLNIDTKSIVFPRNQVHMDYVKVCEKLGIETYRGNSWFNFNNDLQQRKLKGYAMKVSRILDSYFNLSGSNSYKLENYNEENIKSVNIPASRFLRPYSPTLSTLENLKLNRIKSAMTKAAKRHEVYHLWWHPHNFANNIDENFENLDKILNHYSKLNKQYGFKSLTMTQLAREFKKEHAI